ncbi:MAG: hypothetical protein HC804_15160 [Anaerolineae bacterium]|nr:hypothetical protein [Anaerolineae bacterium]
MTNKSGKQVMIVIPSSILDELTHSLKVATDAMTPLANGAHISQAAQLSLAAIGIIALNQAQTAVSAIREKK